MLLVILSLTLATQVSENDPTIEQLKNAYSEIFVAEVHEHEGRKFVGRRITVPTTPPLADFVKENYWLLHYLQTNGTDIDPKSLSALKEEPDELAAHYHRSLVEDRTFNSLLLPVAHRFFTLKGSGLSDYEALSRVQVTLQDLINVAVRFFYPDRVLEKGFQGHICAGINGFKDFQGERNLQVEAFCYEALFQELRSKEQRYRLRDKFSSLLAESWRLKLSADEDKKLARAQGAVWAALARDPDIKQLLIEAYERKKDYLPFEVIFP